ncbi:hypothetical protein N7457_005771 [Penicillium paradoxum]|uniref:uncharacterized protein n=1 Tax=Penicillium paradoxum TaxID=176176 RepID=UPI002548289C|nr:uncharacterized protein N7457_005771 [Penicillium paradoxum]KAJ5780611.1 hypothetical protein N7457_005771 [Penicillium paradoxum]
MTYVELMALYLMLYHYTIGAGATAVFPVPYTNYVHTYTPSSQDIIARSEIYPSIEKPHQAHGEAFDTADNATPGLWTLDKGRNHIETRFADQDGYKRMCEEYSLCPRETSEATRIFLPADFTLLGCNSEFSLDKFGVLVSRSVEYPVAYGHFQVFDHLTQETTFPNKEDWTKRNTKDGQGIMP